MFYHEPVLLKESIDGLAIKGDGIYVDATFGGGGHAKEILERLKKKGKLYGFDQDEDAAINKIDDKRFELIPYNFKHLKRFLRFYKAIPVDGILADLGVSSHQIDSPERGFSNRFDSLLDMRMDQNLQNTAADILNNYSAQELQDIFSKYGEIRNSRTIAQRIVSARKKELIKGVAQLKELVNPIVRGNRNKYYAQLFMALRIEVNDELGALKQLLAQSAEVLKEGGRLVVLSYHSLEDRLVKHFIKDGNFKAINKKLIMASEEEIKSNPRARSAKLRIAEKNSEQLSVNN